MKRTVVQTAVYIGPHKIGGISYGGHIVLEEFPKKSGKKYSLTMPDSVDPSATYKTVSD